MAISAQLRSDVHLVAKDRDLVLLDIAADRYICIPRGADAVSIGTAGAVHFRRAEDARLFQQAGYLSTNPEPAARLGDGPPRPTFGWDDGAPPPRVPAPDAARLAAAVTDAFLHYRGRSFRSILSHASKGALPAEPRISDDLLRRVRQFHQAVIWTPTPGKCLARSFLLLRFLRRCGLDARWVIAVRTWPFAAHCWLQVENLALDDFPERLAVFTPICCV
jgi:hypothetical protein